MTSFGLGQDQIMRRMQELYQPILELETATGRKVYPPEDRSGSAYEAWMRRMLDHRTRLADLWGELAAGVPVDAPVWLVGMARQARNQAEHQRTTWAILVGGLDG